MSFDPLDDLLNFISKGPNTPGQRSGDDWQDLQREIEGLEFEAPSDLNELDAQIKELQDISKSIDKKIVRRKFTEDPKAFKIDYQQSLNPQQLSAVLEIDNPLLVIAGAGSGKTRVITYKVSYLIEKGIPPEQILLLTFTRKASNEMLNRVQQLLKDQSAGKVAGGTFHSFANHILRKYSGMLNLPSNFTIIDTQDAADIVDLIKTELSIVKKKKKRAFPRKARVYDIISKARNLDLTVEETIEKFYSALSMFTTEIELISNGFKKYKKASNLYDYDDLLEVLRDCLRDHKKFRELLSAQYQYILVDEFQDTNKIQNELITLLVGKRKCITVVGDDTQSIYSFRGANFENILRFPSAFRGSKVVKIETNYRSNENILNFTNNIVDTAVLGFKKKLSCDKTSTAIPIIQKFGDAESEAEFIVDQILEFHENDIPFSEMAILTRSSWHSNFVQTELFRRSIPYIVVGGIKFNERRHVKDILALLRLSLNLFDAVSWHRVLKLLNGIGNVTARKIIEQIHNNNGELEFAAFEKKKFYPDLIKLQKLLHQLRDDKIAPGAQSRKAVDYYGPILEGIEDDYQVRLKDLDVIIQLAEKYGNLEKFLSDFALDPPSNKFQDSVEPLLDQSEEAPVTVSTVHSAKGLEWYAVFIPYALDGLFPSSRALGQIRELEEERRLFYVACSRAKEHLFISMPSYVSSWDAYFTQPSRFIAQLKKDSYKTY